MPDYIMPNWSCHRGEDISDVQRDYLEFILEWMEDNDVDNEELYEAIEDELSMRDRSHVDF